MNKALIFTLVLCLIKHVSFTQHLDNYNVLVIIVDDLNDWTEPGGGHPQSITPNFTRFAEEAITFRNAHSNSPICNPSRISFLTGIRPTSSGVFFNSPRRKTNFSPQDLRSNSVLSTAKALPEYFADNDYATIGMGKIFHSANSHSELWSRWTRVFGNYGSPDQEDGFLANGVPEGLTDTHMDWGTTDEDKNATRDFITANWIADQIAIQDSSFLAVAGIYRPHLPWYLPSEYFDKFDLESIIVPSIDSDDLGDVGELSISPSVNYPTLDSLDLKKEAVQAYLAAINYADESLGIILNGLEESRHSSNTIVVIIGDHGWHLGEKLRYKKKTLWDEGTKTTFMIKIPGHPGSGEKIDAAVSLLDLYPTLLELCNMPPNSNLEGESLLSIIENPEAYNDRIVLSTLAPNDYSVKSKRWRYTEYGTGTKELYDHENDSLERINLISDADYTDIASKLKISMDSVLLKDKRAIQYPVTKHYFPGAIQFEKYDSGGEGLAYHDNDTLNDGNGLIYDEQGFRFDGVDVYPSNDEGGGFYVHMQSTEWMEYSLYPNSLDAFQFSVRYRSPTGIDSELAISIDGIVYDTISLSGSDDSWATATGPVLGKSFESDSMNLRVELLEGEVDLNYLETRRKHYPEIAEISPIEVPENEFITEALVQVNASDADRDSLMFSIVGSTPFLIDSHGNITTNERFDFEEKNSYIIKVLTSDGFLNDTSLVELNIVNVNEPPIVQDMNLLIAENQEINSVLDTLIYSDPEEDDLVIQVLNDESIVDVNETGAIILREGLDLSLSGIMCLQLLLMMEFISIHRFSLLIFKM